MSQIMLQIPYMSPHSEALQRGIRQGCSLGPYLFIVLSAFTSDLTSEPYVSASLLLNGDCHPKYEALAPPPPILNAQYFGSFITPTASIPSVFVAHKLICSRSRNSTKSLLPGQKSLLPGQPKSPCSNDFLSLSYPASILPVSLPPPNSDFRQNLRTRP